MWRRLISTGMDPGIQSTPFIKEIHTCCLRYTIFFRLYIYIYIYPCGVLTDSWYVFKPFLKLPYLYSISALQKYGNGIIHGSHSTWNNFDRRPQEMCQIRPFGCNAVCGMSCAVRAAFCYALTMHCNPQGTQHTCVAAFHNVTDYEPMTCTYMTFGKRNIHLYQMMNMLVFNLPEKLGQ